MGHKFSLALKTKNPKTLSTNELGFTSEVPSGFEPLWVVLQTTA